MPYITEEMRGRSPEGCKKLSEQIGTIIATIRAEFDTDDFEGVCNYTISRIVAGVMKPKDGWRYKWLNRAYGTFLGAGAEFYRRVVGPYEDRCVEKNGDIPEYKENAV